MQKAFRHQSLLCRALALALSAALLPAGAFAATKPSDVGYGILYPEAIATADASGKPAILYVGRAKISMRMRSQPDANSEAVGAVDARDEIQIFGFDQYWLYCWDDEKGVYYLGRHNVDEITPLSPDTPAYGVVPNAFTAVTSADTSLRVSPSASADEIAAYPAGTRLSFWLIEDGWAVVPYRRQVGYMYLGDLTELTPVSPTVDYARDGDILAAFTTFYAVTHTELNIGRMENIRLGCQYIGKTYQPGEEVNFNTTAGPHTRARGYLPSPVLIDGGTVAGYGGGTCQVSTTLYNVLLQLPQGMTIVHRRPHGPGGASYAPHGVDAAVGRGELNLIFRNDFDFPITIDCTAQNGSLCICIRKGAWTPEAEETTVEG